MLQRWRRSPQGFLDVDGAESLSLVVDPHLGRGRVNIMLDQFDQTRELGHELLAVTRAIKTELSAGVMDAHAGGSADCLHT